MGRIFIYTGLYIYTVVNAAVSIRKRKFVICPFVYEQTNGSYPFANGPYRLAIYAHLFFASLHYYPTSSLPYYVLPHCPTPLLSHCIFVPLQGITALHPYHLTDALCCFIIGHCITAILPCQPSSDCLIIPLPHCLIARDA
jgi:hypothetical protein